VPAAVPAAGRLWYRSRLPLQEKKHRRGHKKRPVSLPPDLYRTAAAEKLALANRLNSFSPLSYRQPTTGMTLGRCVEKLS
jgi:hypothetical protein